MKKIVFLTGTRAEYGKMKSLMREVENSKSFELYIFVTGMHMLEKYDCTYREIEKDNFKNIYKYINQDEETSMDIALSNTINGFSDYINKINPNLIVVHGDRIEAFAGAIVGALNNIKVMHIEGGEVSGTIDESIRHSITKMAHYHLVANEEAKKRVIQLGENEKNVIVFGSPDIDIMYSKNLPNVDEVKRRYDIDFESYAIFMYNPVTTEIMKLKSNINKVITALEKSNKNFLVIYPNNDLGSNIIIDNIERLRKNKKFRILQSMRFEYFLTALKHCEFIIGNSSCGIMEACVYGKSTIDIGNRQDGRYKIEEREGIIKVSEEETEIINAINKINDFKISPISYYGKGNSSNLFIKILQDGFVWDDEYQKKFIDLIV